MKNFFNELQYSLTTEDTSLEYQILKSVKPKKVLSACQSGARVLPMFSEGVKKLLVSEESLAQLALLELRIETIKKLSFEEYMSFWGYPPFGAYDYSHKRRVIFDQLNISPAAKDLLYKILNDNSWKSPIYLGRWEKTFYLFSVFVRGIMGKKALKIFDFHNLSDQVHFYNNDFPIRRWKFVITALGNKEVFNALVYKGNYIKKNIEQSHFDYFYNGFERLFNGTLARESFFLNLCFFGKIRHKDANPIEANESIYNEIKSSLPNIEYSLKNKDIITACEEESEIDFISFSDMASYYEGENEFNFLQKIKKSLSPGATIVLRHHLRVPNVDISGFVDITPRFSEVISDEKVQMYQVQVLQFDS